MVGILTAGDDRVCQKCEDFAEDAPYEIEEVRDVYPLHPRCRCSVYPWEDLRFKGDTLDAYDPNELRDPLRQVDQRWRQWHYSSRRLATLRRRTSTKKASSTPPASTTRNARSRKAVKSNLTNRAKSRS